MKNMGLCIYRSKIGIRIYRRGKVYGYIEKQAGCRKTDRKSIKRKLNLKNPKKKLTKALKSFQNRMQIYFIENLRR